MGLIHAAAVFLLVTVDMSAATDGSDRFLAVFDTCSIDLNIPPAQFHGDKLIETMFTVLRENSTYQQVIECVAKKTKTLANSTDNFEWFLGHMFSPGYATTAISEFPVDTAEDWSCLKGSSDVPACFNTTLSTLEPFRKTMHGVVLSIDEFRRKACGALLHVDLLKCAVDWMEAQICSRKIQTIVGEFVTLFTGGPCSSVLSTKSPPATSPTSTPVTYFRSSIFECIKEVYPGKDLTMLFPPSEATRSYIHNSTWAAAAQRSAMKTFCSQNHHVEYAKCVRERLTAPRRNVDKLLMEVLDIDNLSIPLELFCNNTELIASQFDCTLRHLDDISCRGGLFDIVAYYFSGPRFGIKCRDIRKKMDCRVNKHLRLCGDVKYAGIMDTIYTGLLSPQCRTGKAILLTDEHSKQTDLMQCNAISDYLIGLLDRMNANESSHVTGDFSDYAEAHILDEMEIICSRRREILDCVEYTLPKSDKPFDSLLKNMFSFRNIGEIADFVCGVVSVLKPHEKCLLDSSSYGGFSNCSNDHMEHNATTSDELLTLVCKRIGPIGECLTHSFGACSGDLAKKFETLVDGLSKSCNNHTYVLRLNEANTPPHITTVTGDHRNHSNKANALQLSWIMLMTTVSNIIRNLYSY